jgi:putative phosphoribosyl transferase
MYFVDRTEAGLYLAARLSHLAGTDVVVLGLPRGGIPVAYEVARALGAPLDVIVVRKLGVPFQPEYAMGAIGEADVLVVNDDVVKLTDVTPAELAQVEARERAELERRSRLFRAARPRVSLQGQTVVIVDDGVATGATARAACQVARAQGAWRVIFAAPVGPPQARIELEDVADEVVLLLAPDPFFAVGQCYDDFRQVSDGEVVQLLDRADAELAARLSDPPLRDDDVTIAVDGVRVEGHLTVPEAARGVVVFAHGSGSSRHSPRNRFVARVLQEAQLATLLFDLLTADEELDRANVFDVPLLAHRLAGATAWVRNQPEVAGLPIGYFGASTGAAAALWSASDTPGIGAVVSRGGRPDLARPRLRAVRAPTLLIVGSNDPAVLELNEAVAAELRCEESLRVVRGASHLFDEPGTLEVAAGLARDWFLEHLAQQPRPSEEGEVR